MTPDDIVEKLLDLAHHRMYTSSNPDPEAKRRFHQKNPDGTIDLPQDLKPGFLLTLLTLEERETLKNLKSSDMLTYRIFVEKLKETP